MTLRDGPAAGSYMVKRAPIYLRGVVAQGHGNKRDVLDQLEDTPRPHERVYVYKRDEREPVSSVHINRGRRDGGSGFTVMCSYDWLPDVDGERLRDNEAWRAWCLEQDGGA